MRNLANIALGALMISCSAVLMLAPQDGLSIVAMVLGIGLAVYGVRKLVYFFTMARHKVGGLSVLFVGVIALDAGAFMLTLVDDTQFFIAFYLIGYNVLEGVFGIVHAVEAKMLESRWKASMFHAIVNLALAVACLAFVGSARIIIAIFCIGLIYNGCVRIASAFRPTEIIYIQ